MADHTAGIQNDNTDSATPRTAAASRKPVPMPLTQEAAAMLQDAVPA
jgi:hypothetical protein